MPVAFVVRALVALSAWKESRSSSSRRSSTPQVKAPCAPPPWRASVITRAAVSATGAGDGAPAAFDRALGLAATSDSMGPLPRETAQGWRKNYDNGTRLEPKRVSAAYRFRSP